MKKFLISAIVGTPCENPECEVHGNLGTNFYRLQFTIDSTLLNRILAAHQAFVANKFEGYLTFDIDSEVEVIHYELTNDNGFPIQERKYKELKWKELEPKISNEELYYHFDIDHNGILGFTVDGIEDEEISMVGNFGPIKMIMGLMSLGYTEWPEGEMQPVIMDEDGTPQPKEAPVTKPMLH